MHGKHREPQTEDFEEEWFSSGEARNLACDNPQNCDTGITDVNDEAQSRDWDTTDLPNQEVDSEITSDEVLEYGEEWELTDQEVDNAEDEDDQDDFGTPLDFGSDAIQDMIGSVLQVIS